MNNHCLTCLYLASFELPSLFFSCCIFWIFDIFGRSLVKAKLTALACYCTSFTFDLGYTKEESSFFFILEGRLFLFIVRVIFILMPYF